MKFYREHNINPAASCLPMLVQIPIFFALYFVLKDFEKKVLTRRSTRTPISAGCTSSRTSPNNVTTHWSGYLLVADLHGQPDLVDVLHVDDDGPDAADPVHGPAARLRLLHLERQHVLPGGAAPLLGDDEPVDGRPGAGDAPARAADGGARAAEALVAHAARGGGPKSDGDGNGGSPAQPNGPPPAPAAPRRVKRKKRAQALAHGGRGDGRDRRRGQVGGACASSSGVHPGLDKGRVRFQVVSEGERGLLGVGYSPARVIAAPGRSSSEEPARRGRGAGARGADRGEPRARPGRDALRARGRRGRVRDADRRAISAG